jgi:hypothetical protein
MASVHLVMGTSLSETLKFTSYTIKNWLEQQTSSTFIPTHKKAEKLRDEMKRELENLAETSRSLIENSAKEIEKRNTKTYRRARAMNKLARLFLDRIQPIKVPDRVYYDSFHDFLQKIQEAMIVMEVDIRNWFPMISPFFIIDRRKFQVAFERARQQLKEANNFLTKEYVKTKTLEQTFQIIDKLQALGHQLASIKDQRARVENEKASVERQATEVQQRIAELRSKGSLSQLNQINTEIGALTYDIKHNLRHLQKPFIKLQSLSLHGGGSGLTQDELKKLNQYLAYPFEALATEEPEYAVLREILQKLSRALSEDKLKLKPEKTRKAEQTMDSVLNKSSLTDFYQKCKEAKMQKNQLLASPEVAEAEKETSKHRERLEEVERRRRVIESEKSTIEQTYTKISEEIQHDKREIEKNIFGFMSKQVHIE